MFPTGLIPCCAKRGGARAALALVVASLTSRVQAQSVLTSEQAADLFNWYYATAFGTGMYSIGGDRVYVLRAPLDVTLREADDKHWGWRVTLPVTVGLANAELPNLDSVHVAGVAFVPGLEAKIPLTANWYATPFANLGMGFENETDASAWIYQTGVRTAYRVPHWKKPEVTLGGQLTWAGYRLITASSGEHIFGLSAGGDALFPLDVEVRNRPLMIGVQTMATTWFNSLQFFVPDSGERSVKYEMELGLVLAVRQPIAFLGIGIDRVGLAYVVGSDGLRGVRLLGSLPF